MKWEDKVEMVQLGNLQKESKESKETFQKFVLDRIDSFDAQAWDMFVNLVSLIPEEMKQSIDFWQAIYQKIKDVDCNDEKFGLRAGMRISLIQTMFEDGILF